jgi:hypothetical protein
VAHDLFGKPVSTFPDHALDMLARLLVVIIRNYPGQAVPILRPLILLALLACGAAGASTAAAQTPPDPATTRAALREPMVFYKAHGGPDACGPGCSDWIAAEGKIDFGAGNRLQRLLLQINGARLPIFFNSGGGRVVTSMEIGRLMRARQLTVSVGRTIPVGCDLDSTGEKSCAAKISAGQPIEAELKFTAAMCDSACVYAVAGGAVRLIPPWVTLGIHDLRADPSRRYGASDEVVDAREDLTRTLLHNYIRLMGIDERLLDKAFAIPNTSMGRLSRDDAARFGLDRREFGETAWRFVERSTPAIDKDFFVRTSSEEFHYVDGRVNLACGKRPGVQYVLAFGRKLLPSDPPAPAAPPPVGIRLSDKHFDLSRERYSAFYVRSTQLAPAALDGVADGATMVLPGAEFGREEGPAGDVTLTMDGFSAAYARLQKACAQGVSAAPALPLESNPLRTEPPAGNSPDAIQRDQHHQEQRL